MNTMNGVLITKRHIKNYATFSCTSYDGLGLKEFSHGISASGALLEYLNDTQKVNLGHVVEITPYYIDEFMRLDISSRRNLELTETLREKSRKGSLLWVLDKTKTAMGARLAENGWSSLF